MATITIASTVIPGWQGNSSGKQLRIYANKSFTAASGTLYPKSNPCASASLGTFFQSYACTVSSSSLVVPVVTIDSTTDSPDNPDATYTAVLWDSTTGKQIQPFFSSFSLSPEPTSTTWAVIFSGEANT